MSTLTIPSKDGGSFSAYVAMPAKIPAPTVIVIQEIFGVNKDQRAKCDALAAEGFIAVCPDLFWRLERNVELNKLDEAEWAKAFDLYKRFDVDKGVEDIRAVRHTFAGHAHSTGKVGAVGYCLGGKLAYLLACRAAIHASVGYYGVEIEKFLDEADIIKGPLMLHIAEEDKFVSKEAQAQIKSALTKNPLVTLHSYPGVNHAFARVGGEHYDRAAATMANSRTLVFLKKHLGL